jgi:hypothetical protein
MFSSFFKVEFIKRKINTNKMDYTECLLFYALILIFIGQNKKNKKKSTIFAVKHKRKTDGEVAID